MKSIKVAILGSGGHAKSCIEAIERTKNIKIIGLIDKDKKKKIGKYKVICDDKKIFKIKRITKYLIIGIGSTTNSLKRKKLFYKFKKLGFEFPIVIPKNSIVSKNAEVSEGTVILNNVFINAGAIIGKNCIINNKSLIEHDTEIEDHCHISTGVIINGNCKIGSGTFIGSGSKIVNGAKIKKNSFLKMGTIFKKK